jgi:hypothetical protein
VSDNLLLLNNAVLKKRRQLQLFLRESLYISIYFIELHIIDLVIFSFESLLYISPWTERYY